MKTTTRNLVTLALCIAPALHLNSCAAGTIPARVASAPATGGVVTVQQIGDTKITTRRLINRPLTNQDDGKVYEEVTIDSPRGRSVEQRIIVRAVPRLETKSIRKS